jgi:hypothetical protein
VNFNHCSSLPLKNLRSRQKRHQVEKWSLDLALSIVKLPFDMDVSPFISNGRIFVPVRYLAEAMGTQASWDAATRTVTLTKGGTTIGMTIGSATLTVNGITSWSDVAPMIRDGRSFLPGRWVAEAFGCTVSWDEATQTMTVLPPST